MIGGSIRIKRCSQCKSAVNLTVHTIGGLIEPWIPGSIVRCNTCQKDGPVKAYRKQAILAWNSLQ